MHTEFFLKKRMEIIAKQHTNQTFCQSISLILQKKIYKKYSSNDIIFRQRKSSTTIQFGVLVLYFLEFEKCIYNVGFCRNFEKYYNDSKKGNFFFLNKKKFAKPFNRIICFFICTALVLQCSSYIKVHHMSFGRTVTGIHDIYKAEITNVKRHF